MPTVLRARVRNALRLRQRAKAVLQRAEAHWRRASSDQLSAIVAHARDAIISIDEDGRVALANGAAQRFLGEAGPPVAGLALPEWLRGELPAGLLAGTLQQVDALVFQPPGRPAITCDVSAVLDTASGRRLVTLTVKDQTLRLRAEAEARERLRVQAESRTWQLMMSYLAHEIGNPLNGVVNLTALLLGPGAEPLTAEQARRLRLVSDCASVLQRLMADALDLARWEAGQFSLQLEPHVVLGAVAYAVDSLRPAAQAARVSLAQPQGDLGAVVLADETRLRQCVHNLVSNACKYGHAGGTVKDWQGSWVAASRSKPTRRRAPRLPFDCLGNGPARSQEAAAEGGRSRKVERIRHRAGVPDTGRAAPTVSACRPRCRRQPWPSAQRAPVCPGARRGPRIRARATRRRGFVSRMTCRFSATISFQTAAAWPSGS